MKRTLIIIGAVFAGLIALAVVGNILPDDAEAPTVPTAVVTVTASPTPTYTPSPDPTPSFTVREQENFDFIERNYVILADLTDDLREHCDAADLSDMALLNRFGDASQRFISITKKWNRIEWSYGVTDKLEESFNGYVRATRSYYRNWMYVLMGEGNWSQQVENILKAEQRLDKFGPRIERELERLAVESV